MAEKWDALSEWIKTKAKSDRPPRPATFTMRLSVLH